MFARSLVPRLRVSLKSRHPLVAQFRYEHSTTEHLPPKRGFRIRTTLHPAHHEEPHRNATTTTATTPLRTIPDGSEENSFCSGAGCRLDWTDTPKTILLVQKPNDKAAETALIAVARFLKTKWKYLNIIIESRIGYLAEEIPFAHIVTEDDKSELTRTVDFVVAIGGDGTMLRVSSLFETVVPPIISFSMGTLGFLMPFDRKSYQEALMRMMKSDLSVLLRTRLACSLRTRYGKKILRDGRGTDGIHVVNEVVLHRGQTPHLARVDVFVDEQFLTDAVGDGLIVATPTGSTAYSLSAGGPIVHPSVSCLILTPICPQSLSFRPALLPGYSKIQLRMSQASRTPAQISFDGSQIGLLDAGEYLQVETSPYSVPCVNRVEEGTDWVRDVNDMLKWNQTFGGGGRGDGT